MKICHFADSHLGAGASFPRKGKSGLTLRQEDIINSFIEAVDAIIDIKPDVCIHAGDIFDSVRPLNSIMAIAGEQLHRLAALAGIPTVIISGNHDAPKQPHVGAAIDVYRQFDNIHIVSKGKKEVITIGEMCIHAVPHCLTGRILQEEIRRCKPVATMRYNVLVAHGVAAGMPEFAMADLGEQEIPVERLDEFDYVALGHFHNYSKVARRAYYSGSTERLSQSERDAAKGFLEVEMEPFHVAFHAVHSRPMVSMQPIDASGKRGDQLAELIKEKIAQVDSSDKIVRVKVEGVTEETLKTLPSDVIAELKQKSFSLDINFQKAEQTESNHEFGRTAIGRLDKAFLEFLEHADLKGLDREKLKTEALRYLSMEE